MSTGIAPRRFDKYELHERLGHGGMAEVWKAWDTQLHRYVAVKILHANLQSDPDFVTRFLREAQAVASLRHSNIVQIYDFQISRALESEGTIAYMVMEYIEGPTLADYIARTSHMSKFPRAEEIVHLFTSIGLAIDYAHQHSVIHRDIKPANILLDQRNTACNSMGEPVLTDFGIAKMLNSSAAAPSGILSGTPLYIAPERAQGHMGEGRSDIYSLGVILYEICTGVQPFRGKNVVSIIMQHISTLPTPPSLINPTIPPALAEVILRCLAKDPTARFPNAASITAALARALNIPYLPASISVTPPLPGNTADMMDGPTHGNASQSELLAEADIEGLREATQPLPVGEPLLPGPEVVSDLQAAQDASLQASASASNEQGLYTPSHPPAVSPKRRARVWFIALLTIIMIATVSSSLGIFLFMHKSPPIVTVSSAEGQAFFVTSGQLNKKGYPGINDELQINLHNVPDPAPGTSYYAWLLRDKTQPASTPILLGMLPVERGEVHFLYPGDSQHIDLLSTTSRVLITQEDAGITPINPAPDFNNWHFYAELPQEPAPNDVIHHYSMLDHLRSLLAEDSVTGGMGIHGGLEIWLLRNTGKVVEWANSARDSWSDKSTNLMRAHFTRILDYLDGESYVQADVPQGTPLVVSAPIGLLGPDPSQSEANGT